MLSSQRNEIQTTAKEKRERVEQFILSHERKSIGNRTAKMTQPKKSESPKPDFNGLFSLVMRNEHSPSIDPVDLECLFGQAGVIQNINITKGYTFIRYQTAKEAVKALELFGEEYHLQLPRSSTKTTNMQKKENLLSSDSPSVNGKKDFKPTFSHQKKEGLLSPESPPVSGKKDFKPTFSHKKKEGLFSPESPPVNGKKDFKPTFSHQKKEGLLSPESPPVNGKKDFKPTFSHQNGSMKSPDKIGVFIANIENDEDFEELIRPYQPTNVKVINKENKIFAFITVRTLEVADRMIADLNGKVQYRKKLYVTYNKNMKSQDKGNEDDNQSAFSDTESSDNSSFTTKRSSQKYQSPVLVNGHSKASTTDFTGMPKLVHESELPEERYRLCWCIFISNFPPYSLESTLRNVFEKYHVLDMCIKNNSNYSSTKAVLYLATVYDVIDAIRDMNGFQMDGRKLLVSIPYFYKIERQVVYNALEREENTTE